MTMITTIMEVDTVATQALMSKMKWAGVMKILTLYLMEIQMLIGILTKRLHLGIIQPLHL